MVLNDTQYDRICLAREAAREKFPGLESYVGDMRHGLDFVPTNGHAPKHLFLTNPEARGGEDLNDLFLGGPSLIREAWHVRLNGDKIYVVEHDGRMAEAYELPQSVNSGRYTRFALKKPKILAVIDAFNSRGYRKIGDQTEYV